MKAAFTDRSIRLREGRAARSVLCPGWQEPEEQYQDCSSFDLMHPAGQPSHSVVSNKERDSNPCSGDQSAFASSGVSSVLNRQLGGPQEELAFRQAMTRKVRQAPSQTSNPQDPQDADAVSRGAGAYRRRGFLETGLKQLEDDPIYCRGNVSYVLSPKDEDPPHPHHRITTGGKKGSGAYRDQMDPHTERLMVHWNQSLYRYDVFAAGGSAVRPVQRTASCPPDHAGMPRTENRDGSRNPITHEERGSPITPRTLRGRAGLGNSSGHSLHKGQAVKSLTNHENMAEEALRDRSNRLSSDQKFAELCALTAQCGKQAKMDAADIKVTKTRHLSTNVANALRWDA